RHLTSARHSLSSNRLQPRHRLDALYPCGAVTKCLCSDGIGVNRWRTDDRLDISRLVV
ncbi:hypothetical protein TorRG33x02_308470, partial [Trema orientale]